MRQPRSSSPRLPHAVCSQLLPHCQLRRLRWRAWHSLLQLRPQPGELVIRQRGRGCPSWLLQLRRWLQLRCWLQHVQRSEARQGRLRRGAGSSRWGGLPATRACGGGGASGADAGGGGASRTLPHATAAATGTAALPLAPPCVVHLQRHAARLAGAIKVGQGLQRGGEKGRDCEDAAVWAVYRKLVARRQASAGKALQPHRRQHQLEHQPKGSAAQLAGRRARWHSGQARVAAGSTLA